MTENSTATLTTYITDMHALINHGLKAIDRQAEHMQKKAPPPEVLSAVHEFQRVLRGHLLQLDARAKALGGKTTQPLKEVVTTVTGIAAGLISAVRPEEASKGVRDDYTFLSHVAIGYLMLYTTATGLGDDLTASLAEQGYQDAARLVMRIDQLMPALVLQELHQDGLPVGSVSDQTIMMIRRAWSREAEHQGFRAGQSAPSPAA